MRLALVMVLAAGCTSNTIGTGNDAGGDGPGAADLAGAGCNDISSSVNAWLQSHQSCTVDGDCVQLKTACGLPGQCGAFVNTSTSGPYLKSLTDAWTANSCGG